MKKSLGYVLMAVGIIVFLLSFSVIRTSLKITLPTQISDAYIMIAGAILLILGAYVGFGSQQKNKVQEVPIYQGKDVVGYRRLGKK